jgi:trk system potassium uptake protein TrkA
MKILIAGAGRLGAQAAHLLAATRHKVTVIDVDRARLAELGGDRMRPCSRRPARSPASC